MLIIGIAITSPVRLLLGHFSTYEYSLNKRQELAKNETGDIDIAVMWNNAHFGDSFERGANLALEEENKRPFTFTKDKGRQIQKKIVLHYFNAEKADNKQMSEGIAYDRKIVAAISAQESGEALDTSVLFEQHGIVFISTFATDQHLTNHGFNYTFSTIPVAVEYAKALVDFTEFKGYKKIAYLYPREGLGALNFTISYSTMLFNKDIHVVTSNSFDSRQEDYRQLIYKLLEHPADAILFLAKGKVAARMINQLRSMGIDKPVMGYIGLDDLDIWEASEGKSYNTFVASTFEAMTEEDKALEFYSKFYAKYGYYPNYLAIQGYNALKMVAAAIRKGNSSIPINIAGTLKYHFKGEYKDYYFNSLGRIENEKIIIKEMKNGEFYNTLRPE
ncbi:MAG: ABC transporter substrate-binding protein [Methylovulum sp.]|nr:ABC transporter substrate-binding protein [Methylovulum sp.]